MNKTKILLYGANGYTGKLIASMAADYGLQPILAGRNREEISRLAEKYHLSFRIFDLTDVDIIATYINDCKLVLHAAGPFLRTAKPMIKACMQAGVHYLDITGEIAVFEMAKKMHQAAEAAGVILMPGVGFDVVPTDCMALYLHQRMPDATHLQLAFASVGGGVSHGTATTMVTSLGSGGAARENGMIVSKPLGHKGMTVDFGVKKRFVMTIPWGDVSTAHHTTGIPNIETYTAVKPAVFRLLKWQWLVNPILRTAWVKKMVQKKIDASPAGPDDKARATGKSLVWGCISNAAGESITAHFSGPEGYTLTAHAALIIAKKVLEGNFMKGYQTPAGCFGKDLVLEIPETYRSEYFVNKSHNT